MRLSSPTRVFGGEEMMHTQTGRLVLGLMMGMLTGCGGCGKGPASVDMKGGGGGGGSPSGGGDLAVPGAGDMAQPMGLTTFKPSNIDLTQLALGGVGDVDLADNCTLDSDAGTIICRGSTPTAFNYKPFAQAGGGTVATFVFRSLVLENGYTLTMKGQKAVVLIANGSIVINGDVELSSGYVGAFDGSGPGRGIDGVTATTGSSGGGYCGRGGAGASGGGPAAAGGATYGNATITPLVGGSPGGLPASNYHGYGGGALQLIAGTSISIAAGGAINAGGAGGLAGDAAQGGGSGGSILLEAPSVVVAGTLVANGGGGGDANGAGQDPLPNGTIAGGGGQAGGAGSQGASPDGVPGTVANSVIGSGGGGAGRIRINTLSGKAAVSGTVTPALTTSCATQGVLAH